MLTSSLLTHASRYPIRRSSVVNFSFKTAKRDLQDMSGNEYD